jgi:hypothetical protein
MLLAKHRNPSWRSVSVLWKGLGGWGRRTWGDSISQEPWKAVQDVCEEAVSEVPAHNETTVISNAVVLGLPAIAALDKLFEEAGIDRDLGNSPS